MCKTLILKTILSLSFISKNQILSTAWKSHHTYHLEESNWCNVWVSKTIALPSFGHFYKYNFKATEFKTSCTLVKPLKLETEAQFDQHKQKTETEVFKPNKIKSAKPFKPIKRLIPQKKVKDIFLNRVAGKEQRDVNNLRSGNSRKIAKLKRKNDAVRKRKN